MVGWVTENIFFGFRIALLLVYQILNHLPHFRLRIDDVTEEAMMESFQVNAVAPLLLTKVKSVDLIIHVN